MSEVIVLDTHIWLWQINANFDQFPAHWPALFESADRVCVSPISCYEIALAHKKGRLELSGSMVQDWFERSLSPAGIELLPVNETVASCAVELSDIHKDPFDRLIIATAIVYGAQLASVDKLFVRYDELKDILLT